MDWIAPSLLGLIGGILLPLIIGSRILSPASQMRRGYTNAVAVGILLMAAIEFIPTTLGEIESVGYSLLKSYVISPLDPEPDTVLWALTRFAQFQMVARALLASAILILFFQSNAITSVSRQQTPSEAPASRLAGWRSWLILPSLEEQADQAGMIIVIIGLTCYNLWLGVSRASIFATGGLKLFLAIALVIFSAAVLGIALLGLVPNILKYWRWVATASALFGLAILFGFVNLGEQIILTVAPLLLIVGTVCLVYGIGRLLRILQYQIGLGWRTTLTVAISALVLYLDNQFIAYLI